MDVYRHFYCVDSLILLRMWSTLKYLKGLIFRNGGSNSLSPLEIDGQGSNEK